jgi:uncharacterized membrane protein
LAKPARDLARMGIIAAVYASLTVGLGSLSYSWIQVRLSEALAPLPILMGFPAVVGITLGCVIANYFSPVGIPDLVLGPLLSMFAAFLSWKFSYKKKTLACLYPVLVNAFGVSGYVSAFYNVPYLASVLTIGIGEFVACFLVGYPLLVALERTHFENYFKNH